MDSIWNSPKDLQPYYNFISKIKLILDEIIEKEDQWVENGMEVYPTPNRFCCKTMDSIYLHFDDDGCVKCLWTPFGKVVLLNSGCGDAMKRVSMEFINKIKTICTLENLSGKIEQSYWYHGK